jgi:hypothetical protein
MGWTLLALVVALVGVVLLAKSLAPGITAALDVVGAPEAATGVFIAALVLLPESLAALRAAAVAVVAALLLGAPRGRETPRAPLLAIDVSASWRRAVGDESTFVQGWRRVVNDSALRTLGGDLGLQSRVVEPVADGGEVVSSSRIREALRDGDPQLAARLLTRPFAIRGIVEHGDKRGRTIGYPTANLAIDSYLRPKYGIYAVTGRILATGEVLHGAANIGIRPQFEPPKELLEPYFFDFSGDLYGQEIEVAFHHFLRGEAKFDGLEALIEQMDKDCAEARRLLSAQPL